MNCLTSWPEPIIRVQSLSESGIQKIPERYVKRPSDRPVVTPLDPLPAAVAVAVEVEVNIPVIDLNNLYSNKEDTMSLISRACSEWGFFQVVNHGVSQELMSRTREVWRDFFHSPVEEKQVYANSPTTYEGYGSRLGVEKGAKLDWSDYFFLHYLPLNLKDVNKWPAVPTSCRYLPIYSNYKFTPSSFSFFPPPLPHTCIKLNI